MLLVAQTVLAPAMPFAGSDKGVVHPHVLYATPAYGLQPQELQQLQESADYSWKDPAPSLPFQNFEFLSGLLTYHHGMSQYFAEEVHCSDAQQYFRILPQDAKEKHTISMTY